MSSCQSCTSAPNAWSSEFFANASERWGKLAQKQEAKGHDRLAARFAERAAIAEFRSTQGETSLPPVTETGNAEEAQSQLLQNAAEFFAQVANNFMEHAQKQADKGHSRLAAQFAEFAVRAATFAASLVNAPSQPVPPTPSTDTAPTPAPATTPAPYAQSASPITINIYGSGNLVNITA